MAISPGSRLGAYEIAGAIGAGGMGEVYRARDPRLDRDVAVKVLPTLFALDPDRVRRFEQEARAVGRLSHPHIVAVYDVGRVPDGLPDAGAPFLVSELLEGQTLRDEMQGRALPWRTAVTFAREIASGLAAAHDKGVVHRDVKPENIFVTCDGHIKILDFGLAKLRPESVGAETVTALNRTMPGVVMGTAGYMSPEQVRGQEADYRSDIFSFGSVFYEMLTGRRAFDGATGAEVMSAILHLDPPPIATDVSGKPIPAAAEPIVRRCLEKSRERRFQSARDLAFSLETLSPAPDTFATTAAPLAVPRPARIRALAIVAGLVVIGVGAWMLWPRAGGNALAPAFNEPPVVTPFLVGPHVETLPAWSPTGNLIAYVSEASGNDDVWISDSTGANPINLTKDHPGIDTFPAWSPDGQQLAFYSDRDGGGIYTMTTLGGSVRRLVSVRPSVVYTFSLQWASDGSIVYTNFDEAGGKQVYRVSTADANPACLTCGRAPEGGGMAGALSPSGKLLAYTSGLIGPRARLFVLDLETGRSSRLDDGVDVPHWRDDGHLMYLSSYDGLPDLWEVAVDPATGAKAGEPMRLTSGLDPTAFAVRAGSKEILAAKEKASSSLWTFPTSAARIDSLSLGTQLTTGDFRDERPRWSADEREIFFQSNRRGSVNVWKVGAAGGEPVRLTSGVGLESRARPSGDGQWLTFDKDGNWTWLMRPDGSGAHAPADWEARYSHVCCAAWSPDSSRVILSVTMRTGENRLAIADVDASTGMFVRLRDHEMPGALEEYARWSPDGRAWAFESLVDGSFDLWVANADGTAPRRVTSLPANERAAAWQAAPLFVYFRDDRAIWRMPMADPFTPAGPPIRWLAIPGLRVTADSLDVSRDSTRIVTSLSRPESDIWLVERK